MEDSRLVAEYLNKERFTVNGQKVAIDYPVLRGNDAVADKFGGLIGYPTNFLISRDGKIVKKILGVISYEETARAIEAQL